MKTHTNSFKENIATFGRELDSKITYELDGVTVELGSEELNSITPHYEGAILKSVMKQLDIDSNVEIPLGTILRYQFGVKVGNGYEYIDYGNYVVYSVEKQEDTYSYKITCYDKMLYAMKDYENSNITFPITIKNYLEAICEKVGLEYEGSQFVNSDKVIDNELYLDNEGRSLGYTFRDVFDEIAQVSGSTICINEDDKLEVRYIHDVGELQSQTGSSLTLETDDAIKLDSFELEGKTTQETRSGKNLANNLDFTFTSDGTSSYQWNYRSSDYIPIENNTYYALSFYFNDERRIDNIYGYAYAYIYDENKTLISNVDFLKTSNVADTIKQNTNANAKYLMVKVGVRNYVSGDKIKVQLEKGNSVTNYEPYGAMPSPDYPSELVSVGYENLFNWNNPREITLIKSTNRTITATPSGALTLEPGTYTLSFSNLQMSNNNYNLSVELVGIIGGGALTNNYRTFTISETKTLQYLYIYLNNSDNANATAIFSQILLIKGSQPHNYIPYGKYGIEVKTNGKNLLDFNDFLTSRNAIYTEENGIYNITNMGQTYSNPYELNLKPNTTYTISQTYQTQNSTNLRLEIFQDSTLILMCYATNQNLLTRTFTTNSSSTYKIRANYTSFTSPAIFNKPILEENLTSSAYEPYIGHTNLIILDNPLRSIGDTKDLLYIKNGMLYVERKIGKLVLDGSETDWSNQSGTYDTANRMMFSHNCSSDIQENMANRKGLSNYFVNYPSTVQNPNVDVTAFNFHRNINYSKYIYFKIEKSVLSSQDVAGFKSWLSTHNTEVQYVLDTPYTEEIGQVEMPSTYEGITYIETTDSNTPTMNITYISEFEEIDEEYLKDVNVNFGEKFGKVNTLVLSRGGDGDKISLSIPSDLADEDKVAIQITDNQIMNDNNRADYMQPILNQLYGLEYYINDFSSTGICYLDLCDRYRIKIGNNSYKCIMFNDEVDITQGLEELIYTDMQEENEQEYKYIGSTDRGITQANIIANKADATISSFTQQLDATNNRLNSVEVKQTATDETINIISTNIDDNGNITEVTTTTGFTFNADGMTIADSETNFKALHRNTGTYYYDGDKITGQYTKDGSKQKDLELFGVYYYGKEDINDTPMFVAQLYTDENGEECFGHFYNRGD